MERQQKVDCDQSMIGDGYCDDGNSNLEVCNFDGWDCCKRVRPDWNSRCTECKCWDFQHPNFNVAQEGTECKDILNGGNEKSCKVIDDVKGQRRCEYCKGNKDGPIKPKDVQICKNFLVVCQKTCNACIETKST